MAYDRLTAQDASFLHLEHENTPMHVGSLGIFEGAPFFDDVGRFKLNEARDRIASRLHLVPRFRQKLMTVPLGQGRPIWVDDEAFDLSYHVRLTALPSPGNEAQLKALMNRLQAIRLDRRRPLWELWFVEGLEGGRAAIIQKTHHALVDGISGVDVAVVVLDLEPAPPPADAPSWHPRTAPSAVQLLADTLAERATEPAELARTAMAVLRGPADLAGRLVSTGRALASLGATAPRTPFNVPVGPHRRFETVRVSLDSVKEIKSRAGATVNDVVLAGVTGGLRAYLAAKGEDVEELTLRAIVPVSIRAEDERGALGNRVSALVVELPVGLADPADRLNALHEQMRDLKESEQAVGAEVIVSLTGYLPDALLALGARLLPFQRSVNLGITNVPGPQTPLWCMGARMLEAFPYVGVVDGMALMVAVLSYDGQLGFGLTGDRDAVGDLAVLAEGIEKAMGELRASR